VRGEVAELDPAGANVADADAQIGELHFIVEVEIALGVDLLEAGAGDVGAQRAVPLHGVPPPQLRLDGRHRGAGLPAAARLRRGR
jgi:hypothetical protein